MQVHRPSCVCVWDGGKAQLAVESSQKAQTSKQLDSNPTVNCLV